MLLPKLDFTLTHQKVGVSNYLRIKTTKNEITSMFHTARSSGNQSTSK